MQKGEQVLLLFVQISLNGKFRGLFKWFILNLDLHNLTVIVQMLVRSQPDMFWDFRYGFGVKSCLLHSLLIKIYQSNNFRSSLNNDRFNYERLIIDYGLYLFRVYILTICRQEHTLASAFNKNIAFFIYNTHIASSQIAIFSEGIGSSNRIFVIASADIHSFGKYFPRDMARIL